MDSIPLFAAHHRASDNQWQTVPDHLLGVGKRSKTLGAKLGLTKLAELIGLLHDLGKYSKSFQDYLKSALGALNPDEDEDWVDAESLKGKVDHSTAGAQMAWQDLKDNGPAALIAAQVAALCIASHHSGLIDCIATDGEDNFTRRMEKTDDKTHLAEALRAADAVVIARCRELLADPELVEELQRAIRGVVARNKIPEGNQALFQQIGLVVRFLFSCLIDADRIDTADFEDPRGANLRANGTYAGWPLLVERLERSLADMPVRHAIDELRRDISLQCRQAASRPRGIYTLTVPTGGGKTLASLRFALHHAMQRKLDRIVYVIPFTSIIDQNAQVVRSVLEPSSAPKGEGRIVLEHHGSVTPERQKWREKILCENWDAPVVYTTMVQFLEALFGGGTRGARRMHQLANAVLVFDEVQTLPVPCVHLFNNAVNFLAEQCNSTVVLCTATQPLLDRVEPKRGAIRLSEHHEIMRDVQGLFRDLKRVEVRDCRKPGGWTHDEVAALALGEVRRDASCLVVVNTKRAARRVFELTRPSLDQDSVCHLSTDMCPAHRKAELARVRQRLADRLPILCVSTQLIEAGVDVDFRTVVRCLAGLDSMAQAAGRCNRNGALEHGIVHIVNLADEDLEHLPDIAIGRDKAQTILDTHKDDPAFYEGGLVDPAALEDYYRHYFFERENEMSYRVPPSKAGRDETLLRLLSVNELSVNEHRERHPPSTLFFKQAFMTAGKAFKAIDAPTQGVVVPYGKGGEALINDLFSTRVPERQMALLRTAQQYTVSIFPHVLKKLQEAGALRAVDEELRILCLDPRFYSPDFGLSTTPVSKMETLHVCD